MPVKDILKFLFDRGPFCGATGTLCFRRQMTLPMGFKAYVDLSSHVLFCGLCTMIPRAISGCRGPGFEPGRLTCEVSTMPLRNQRDINIKHC